MKYLSIAVSLLLLSACSMPLLALAQQESAPDGPPARTVEGPPPGFGHGPGAPGLPPFLHGIDLSEAQQDKVFAATYAQAPLLREQEKIAFKAHAQLRALAGSSAYDDAKASALANTAAQAMAKISLQQARLEQQLLAVLTPEQRQQAQQWHDSRQVPRGPRRLP
ncbi:MULTISPECIES: Spy/CpxP family protein refolding chaperone [Janthinobacterium]|jgi:Spy/CpxP family protein refolding chaperone|uniref:Spy/CpxP family protein refolding chaperone n=1 Tax=Janthinobacterium TaxID=29580 RepID=UPI0008859E78|nr:MULTISPECIES: periplasmic heavy metal sensor [Janthinobacterium]QKY09607.1 periplasmic heavy metal sensor [Janthinobacterium lividum]SDG76761.1 protein refolding chaperone Spy/CpxP family [Janthinobacterium sp. YR213]